jgi:maltooligosyltrehalose trehalohydrolase
MSAFSAATADKMGATIGNDGVHYRTWAPDLAGLTVEVTRGTAEPNRIFLVKDAAGFWSGHDPSGRAGDLYGYRLPDGHLLPDVASRFQPQGVHGLSECIDPATYAWQAAQWQRPAWRGQSIYEIHVGAFSAEGTFRGAIPHLEHVRQIGFEAIQLMPLADFDGRRNWGYDGVSLFAPAHAYGRPDDLRALVDAAHGLGLTVILDVVYNHLGPSGNYLGSFSADYFTRKHHTPWGASLNLDGHRNGPVRALLRQNAAYWLEEFRFDGLRLDATHWMLDDTSPHLLAELADLVHEAGGFLIAEDERNSTQLLNPRVAGGYALDAAWSDDFHHQIRVALTGTRQAYFAGFSGQADEVADTLQHGWTYRGQSCSFWQGRPRGSACDHLPPHAFVVCIENHDQVGNRAFGERLAHLVSARHFRAASLLLCLSPYVPMVFMGQEWSATSPFQFFTDHEGELGRQVTAGRRREFAAFHASDATTPDPQNEGVYLASKLNWAERDTAPHHQIAELYRSALRLRKDLAPILADRARWSARAVGPVIVLQLGDGLRNLLLLSILHEADAPAMSQPGLVFPPPPEHHWQVLLDSEDPRFGGRGGTDGERSTPRGPVTVLLEAVKMIPHAAL